MSVQAPMQDLGWTPPPTHVPIDLVRDFDYFDPPRLQEVGLQMALREVRDASPRIFWTGRNGGHWVATRAVDMEEIRTDFQNFSNTGISIPRSNMPSLPLECDPPLHTGLRRIIAPLFTPDTIRTAEGLARDISQTLARKLAPQGGCEFQSDFSRHLPIAIFLHLVDLPTEDGPYLSDLAEQRVRTANVAKRDAAKQAIIDYLARVVAVRRSNPGRDFISKIVQATVDGRPLSDHELWNVLATVMFGGLDTVASALGYVMRFLAANEDARHWLARQPTVPLSAVDELFRYHGVVSDARLVMKDLTFRGISMRAGEQILLRPRWSDWTRSVSRTRERYVLTGQMPDRMGPLEMACIDASAPIWPVWN